MRPISTCAGFWRAVRCATAGDGGNGRKAADRPQREPAGAGRTIRLMPTAHRGGIFVLGVRAASLSRCQAIHRRRAGQSYAKRAHIDANTYRCGIRFRCTVCSRSRAAPRGFKAATAHPASESPHCRIGVPSSKGCICAPTQPASLSQLSDDLRTTDRRD